MTIYKGLHVFMFPVDCDFETVDICGYKQDTTDTANFDWTRDFGGTRSVGTGPATDHTYGTSNGTVFIY